MSGVRSVGASMNGMEGLFSAIVTRAAVGETVHTRDPKAAERARAGVNAETKAIVRSGGVVRRWNGLRK